MNVKKIKLLPENQLIRTGLVDHADWNYKFVLRPIQRARFKLIDSLIGNRKFGSILEVGYGSGIFLPTLAEFTENLYGIDVHSFNNKVSEILVKNSVRANLIQGTASSMPYSSHKFDAVVSVSTFEFIKDKREACFEIIRVLQREGRFFIVIPAQSVFLDWAFDLLTHESAKNDFGNERQHEFTILMEYFTITRAIFFPPLIGRFLPVYKAFELTPKNIEV